MNVVHGTVGKKKFTFRFRSVPCNGIYRFRSVSVPLRFISVLFEHGVSTHGKTVNSVPFRRCSTLSVNRLTLGIECGQFVINAGTISMDEKTKSSARVLRRDGLSGKSERTPTISVMFHRTS